MRRRRRPRRTTTTCKTKHWRKSTELRDAYAVHSECRFMSSFRCSKYSWHKRMQYICSLNPLENLIWLNANAGTYSEWTTHDPIVLDFFTVLTTTTKLGASFLHLLLWSLFSTWKSWIFNKFTVFGPEMHTGTNWNDRIRSDRNWLIPKMLEPSVWDRISAAIPGWTPLSNPQRGSSSTDRPQQPIRWHQRNESRTICDTVQQTHSTGTFWRHKWQKKCSAREYRQSAEKLLQLHDVRCEGNV